MEKFDIEKEKSTDALSSKTWVLIFTFVFVGWMIAISIIIAGWLISRQISNNSIKNTDKSLTSQTSLVDIEVPAGVPVLGDNNAKVTIVEFADFQCPFCGEWQKNVFPSIKKNFIDTGKARFVFMDFAFLGEESTRAAEAARCAQDQNKFWEYHDKLYESQDGENRGAFSDSNLTKFAEQLGLNINDFNTCFVNGKHKNHISDAVLKASENGIQSTPTVIINNIKLEGTHSYQTYANLIEKELK